MILSCPICLKVSVKNAIGVVKDIWPRHLEVLFCGECSSYYLADMPTEDEYQQLYRSHYYQASVSRSKVYLKNIFREFRTASQARFIKQNIHRKDNLRILEVGAGDGRLLSKLKSIAGSHLENLRGLELSSYYVQYARKKWGLILEDHDFFSLNECFDLIIMSHVFEHFTDLSKVMCQVGRLLTRKGLVFLEVPHSPSPREVSPKELEHYLNTTHTYNFTAHSLLNCWQRFGYSVLSSERCIYGLPNSISKKTKLKVAKLFLEGSGVDVKVGIHAALYLLKYIKNPEKSYQTIPWGAPYWGPGDSVRLLLQKASSSDS